MQGPWRTTSELGTPRSTNGAVHAAGHLYLVGGVEWTDQAVTTVSYAPLNADGTLGAWDWTTSLPAARRSTTPVHWRGFVYLVGGADAAGDPTDAVHYAAVQDGGTLGPWGTTTRLPQALLSHGTVVHRGHLYVVGGNPGPCVATVRRARIGADGTVGAWSTVGALPAARCGIVEAVTVGNGHLYVAGGFDNVDATDTVLRAPIRADGTLGAWAVDESTLLEPRIYAAAAAHDGWLHVVGGQTGGGGGPTSGVERAPINADGSLGAFVPSTSMPEPRVYAGFAIARGRAYVVAGGTDAAGRSPTTTVYYASTGDDPLGTAP